jgi:L-lactate dehydrogenase complex protein LldF
LPKLMRHWREREFERHLTPSTIRTNLALWAWFAKRPALYRLATRMGIGALSLLARGKGAFRSLPLASGWTEGRDLPAPEPGGTFMARYKARER